MTQNAGLLHSEMANRVHVSLFQTLNLAIEHQFTRSYSIWWGWDGGENGEQFQVPLPVQDV